MSEDTEKEFQASLKRIADGEPAPNETPLFNPLLHKEHVADCRRGRKIKDFETCLERIGFVYSPPERLRPWENGMPKTQGEYRFKRGELRLALSEDDICAWFTGPAELWKWMTDLTTADKIKAARADKRRIFGQVPR
jgi:hypothetical protein